MTRTKPAEQRRADLLAASRALFLERGVAATSLDEITSRAGASKGLFYLYFHSKDDLLCALRDEFSTELAARITAAIEPIADWSAKLDACVQVIFDTYSERHELHEVLFHHSGHVSASHRQTHELTLHVIRDLLADGTAAGAFAVRDPEATAILCWASTHGFDPDMGNADARLLRAAQSLFRGAAGVSTLRRKVLRRTP
jgi:TetR/AcrR family transcriptional regulator, transcriptional repressor for nem operon